MSTFWWDLTRASGLVAWLLLTLTLVWGALASGNLLARRGARRWLLDLHPYLGGLGLAALALHVVGAVADPWVGLGWVEVVVPFTAGWRPGGIAAGVVAVWLLGAVQLTSLARRRLTRRTWHRVHLLSYAMAWVATLHAVLVGTDLRQPVVAWAMAAVVAVATLVTARRALARPAPERRRPPARPEARPLVPPRELVGSPSR